MTTTCTSCGAPMQATVAPHAGRFQILCEHCRQAGSEGHALAEVIAADVDLSMLEEGR